VRSRQLKSILRLCCHFSLALAICTCCAFAETKPMLTIDLLSNGLPMDAFQRMTFSQCPFQYRTYRSVQWLDSEHILVAFNTSPSCTQSKVVAKGNLKLIIFDLKGNVLHSTNLPYEAGDGSPERLIDHDGLWIGPGKSVLIEIPSPHLSTLPNSKDRIVVLSDELVPIQEIDTEDAHLWLRGVRDDRSAVLFSVINQDHSFNREKCILYTGNPLQQTKGCDNTEVDSLNTEYRKTGFYPAPKGYHIDNYPGDTSDGFRSMIFVSNGSGLCDLWRFTCPKHGRLIVFETASKRVLIDRNFPFDGRARLSPDGKHLAIFEKNSLEILSLP